MKKLMFFGSGIFPLNMFTKLKTFRDVSLTTIQNRDLSRRSKNEILDFASDEKIETHIPIKSTDNVPQQWSDYCEQISQVYDTGIVCNFGLMLPDEVIDKFSNGIIVVHPSLLPKYRGAAPIQRALMNNEQETGVSFIEISKKKFDAGAILLQKPLQIDPTDRYIELSKKLSSLCADNVEYLINNLDELRRNKRVQINSESTKAPKILENELQVDFSNQSAQMIWNKYRGIYRSTQYSLKLKYKEKELYLEKVFVTTEYEDKLLEQYPNAKPGSIWVLDVKKYKKLLYIKCMTGWLRMEKFRYLDRALIQDSYTFIDQHIKKEEIFGDKGSQGVFYFNN